MKLFVKESFIEILIVLSAPPKLLHSTTENPYLNLRVGIDLPSFRALCEVVPHPAQNAAGSCGVGPAGFAFGGAGILRVSLVVVQAAELAACVGGLRQRKRQSGHAHCDVAV